VLVLVLVLTRIRHGVVIRVSARQLGGPEVTPAVEALEVLQATEVLTWAGPGVVLREPPQNCSAAADDTTSFRRP